MGFIFFMGSGPLYDFSLIYHAAYYQGKWQRRFVFVLKTKECNNFIHLSHGPKLNILLTGILTRRTVKERGGGRG